MPAREITLGRNAGNVLMESHEEGASEAFVVGDVLINDAGQVDEAGAEPVASIIGIAAEAASGTTANEIQVWPARAGIEFEGSIGTSASAGASAQSDLYAAYPLNTTSAGVWIVDKTDNTNPCVIVTGFRDPVGTTNGRVYFEFQQSKTVFPTGD